MPRSRGRLQDRPPLLMITPDFPPDPGGIQSLASGLAAHLSDWELTVVTRAPSTRRGGSSQARDRILRAARPGGRQKLSIALVNGLATREAVIRRPSVILNMHVNTAPAAVLAKRLRGVPVVQYLHAQELLPRPVLTRFAVRNADATIVVSAHTRALAEKAGCDSVSMHLIPPGIELPDGAAPRPSTATGPPTLVTVARFEVEYKGHDVLTEAMPIVRSRVPDARWVVIGEGPLRAGTERRVAELGLSDAALFLGRITDSERDRWLRESDVFVMPSRLPPDGSGEGFGIALLEASAHGLPVVAGAVGGALDAVADGETGLLVDPEDPVAVAEAVSGLLLDRDRARAFGTAGIERSSKFAWPLVAARVDEVLRSVSGDPR